MKIPFIKIQTIGNDYVYVDGKSISRLGRSLPALARDISNRHSGVGSDGLIVVDDTGKNSVRIRIYNSDGSAAELCGNGLRGTVLFTREFYGKRGSKFVIATQWNEYDTEILNIRGNRAMVKSSLGSPDFEASSIGCRGAIRNCLGMKIKMGGKTREIYALAMPNPHAVIFVDNFDFPWQKEGADLEHNRLFKNRVNVMFARVESSKKIKIMPWERGSGATLSCGSGAAAVTVISGLLGCTRGMVKAEMPGGSLKTFWDIEKNNVIQEGPAQIAFTGSYII